MQCDENSELNVKAIAMRLHGCYAPEDEIRDFTSHIKEASMSDIFAHIKPEEEYSEMRAEIASKAQQIDSLTQQIDSMTQQNFSQTQQIDSMAQQIDSLSQENKDLRAQLAAKHRFPFNLFDRSRR